ncbi:MAG: hypothetical protein KAU17_12635 [Spirochaetales bacterium]|nr:hypothetical protein [Spirochaetales bacterium]
MDENIIKKIKLGDELDNSIKQIITALKELQTTVQESSYYFITFQFRLSGNSEGRRAATSMVPI